MIEQKLIKEGFTYKEYLVLFLFNILPLSTGPTLFILGFQNTGETGFGGLIALSLIPIGAIVSIVYLIIFTKINKLLVYLLRAKQSRKILFLIVGVYYFYAGLFLLNDAPMIATINLWYLFPAYFIYFVYLYKNSRRSNTIYNQSSDTNSGEGH